MIFGVSGDVGVASRGDVGVDVLCVHPPADRQVSSNPSINFGNLAQVTVSKLCFENKSYSIRDSKIRLILVKNLHLQSTGQRLEMG